MEQKIKNKNQKKTNNHSSIYLVWGVKVGGVVVYLQLDEDVSTCELQTVTLLFSHWMSDATPLKDGNSSEQSRRTRVAFTTDSNLLAS